MSSGIKGQIVSKILGLLDQIDETADGLTRCQRLADAQGHRIDRLGERIGRLESA